MLTYLSYLEFGVYFIFLCTLLTIYTKYKKHRKAKEDHLSIFMYFLIFTSIGEIVGNYATYIYVEDLNDFQFFCDFPGFLYANWWYNSLYVLLFVLLGQFIKLQLTSKRFITVASLLQGLFIASCLINFISTDVFFETYSKLVDGGGLALLVGIISFYFYEILSSAKILYIKSMFPFYVAVISLLYNLTVTPIFFSWEFYTFEEIVFIKFYDFILNFSNYFLYGMFIFSLLKCYWFNKSQSKKFYSSATLS